MHRLRGLRPSPALVVAVLALVAALAGSAVAEVATLARLDKKEKKQVRKIARKVAKKQIKKQGAIGPSIAYASSPDHSTVLAQDPTTVAATNAPAGSYVINAKVGLLAPQGANFVDCSLVVTNGGGTRTLDSSTVELEADHVADAIPLQAAVPTTDSASYAVRCSKKEAGVAAAVSPRLTATTVGSVVTE